MQFVITAASIGDPKTMATKNCTLTSEGFSKFNAWNTYFTETLAGHFDNLDGSSGTSMYIYFYWDHDYETDLPKEWWPHSRTEQKNLDLHYIYDQVFFRYKKDLMTVPYSTYTVNEPQSLSGISTRRRQVWVGEDSLDDFEDFLQAIQKFFGPDKNVRNIWFGSGGSGGSGGGASCSASSDVIPCAGNVLTDALDSINLADCGQGAFCDYMSIRFYREQFVIRVGPNAAGEPTIIPTIDDCTLLPDQIMDHNVWSNFLTGTVTDHPEQKFKIQYFPGFLLAH